MDQDRFDKLARAMAGGTSRRQVLRRMIAGAMGGAAVLTGARSAGAQPAKVNICHRTGSATNPFEYITVSANAIPDHTAHGDAIDPNFMTDPNNCNGCGIVCDDGNACTQNLCVAGACSHPPIDCTGFNTTCTVGVCNAGVCSAAPANEGGSCDDGVACTENDVCTNGTCAGTAKNCAAAGDQCNAGVCDPGTGNCIKDPTEFNGDTCDDGLDCTENDICTNGTCAGTAVICPDDECNTGFCDEDNAGACGKTPANEDGSCTTAGGVDGTCVAGTCEPVCGRLFGVISSSQGGGIGGATVAVDGQSTTTDVNGNYGFQCVDSGEQTVSASATGFNTNSVGTTIVAGIDNHQNLSLVPISNASQITVVLNWNSDPRDLDSHMSGPDGSGGTFHVYYANSVAGPVSLDVDDVDGNGPETVTVIEASGGNFVPGEYHYWVHNYLTAPEFDVSGAQVQFFQDGTNLGTFLVSNVNGDQSLDLWHVFNFTLDANGVVSQVTVQQMVAGGEGTVL